MPAPCKLGTQPFLAEIHKLDNMFEVGEIIRVRESSGYKWMCVKVTRIKEGGYFFCEKWPGPPTRGRRGRTWG